MPLVAALLWVLWFALAVPAHLSQQSPSNPAWVDTFRVQKTDLRAIGRNPYFILEPGYRLVLEGPGAERLIVTVLDDVQVVDGVETRIVEERETKNGDLVEVSRNFFAIDSRTSDVYYFGEEVDIYRNGIIVDHEGAWRSGVNGARFGLMMPAAPRVGARYYQEIAPKLAMDRAEIVALDVARATPAGKFSRVLKIEETTPLEPGAREYKFFAEGVGLIADGALELVKYGMRVER